ncbi:MAG: hypothetical protein JWQ07_4277 [Ramlibacter sp.]|nr:hypothetical protein [Ramlibacter sp.]
MHPPHPHEPLLVLRGRVESRRVLRPVANAPRMEISFSGTCSEGSLGAASGACSFVAQANGGGTYVWHGRGVFFLPDGCVSSRSWGRGLRDGHWLIYKGSMTFQAHATVLNWLDIIEAAFEYRQDMLSLDATLCCHAVPAQPRALPLFPNQEGDSPC